MKSIRRSVVAMALWMALAAPAFAVSRFPFSVYTYGYAPSAVSAFGRLFVAYESADHALHVAQSYDGSTFVADNVIATPAQASRPSITFFNGRLYVAYLQSRAIYITSSADGWTFSTPIRVGTATSWMGVTLAASPTKLFLAWVLPETGRCKIANSSDGISWTTWSGYQTITTQPAMTWLNDTLYLAWTYDGLVRISRSPDGMTWETPTRYDGVSGMPNSSSSEPSGGVKVDTTMTAVNGVLHVLWAENGIVRLQRALAPTAAPYMASSASVKHMYEFQDEPWLFFKLNGAWYISRIYELNRLD